MVEVKSDEGFRDWGNIFVEYECSGKPSGIQTTESWWWAVEFCDDVFLVMNTERLKKWAREYWKKGDKYRRDKAGDHGRSRGVVIPLAEFVTNLKEEDYKAFGPSTSAKKKGKK